MMTFCAFLGPIGWPELLVILGLVLIVFGPRRLPEIAEALGKSIKKFRTATSTATSEVKREIDAAKQDALDDPERDKNKKESES